MFKNILRIQVEEAFTLYYIIIFETDPKRLFRNYFLSPRKELEKNAFGL